jgi:phospholipid/cholesterol/gamma-HCH transport system substrate-binding protein
MRKALSAQAPRVYGVIFLVMVLVFVWLTYAIFSKKFSSYDKVTLESSKIGLSLPARADVKIRGVIVGEVLKVATDGDGAELTLGLYPDQTRTIPENVSAQILPKTLFGEKYVALQVPEDPAGPIKAGDTIQRSNVSIELEAVLNDLFPLLRAVRPTDLNYTLNAISNALEGRGDKLGNSLETLDSYLRKFNPDVPDLIDSVVKLGKVSETYNSVIPELTRILRNSVKTTGTLESKDQQVKALFTDVAGFSDTSKAFLDKNGDNLITLADQGQRILPLLARYSPQYECFIKGIVGAIPRQESTFRDKTLHIIVEPINPEHQPRAYTASDRPQYADNRGPFPYCKELREALNGKFSQKRPFRGKYVPQIKTGADYNFNKRAPVSDAVGGTAEEQLLIGAASSPVLGVPLDEVPDITTLLLGPLARGMELDVR